MFNCVANNTKFSADKWRFDEIDCYCSVSLSKSNAFLLIYCKLKTNFIFKSQLLTRVCKQNKNRIFIFKSVRVRLRESVRLRECLNIEFNWEVKQGFEKAFVCTAVRLRECPLPESWLYLTVHLMIEMFVNRTHWLNVITAQNFNRSSPKSF